MSASNSRLRTLIYSLLSALFVVGISLMLQWLIYADLLHHRGPVRLVGTLLACVITFSFVWHWQESVRREKVETQRRLDVIAEMNDRIRNALQAIECITYAKDQTATQAVRYAVNVIDTTLRGVSSEFVNSHTFQQAVQSNRGVRGTVLSRRGSDRFAS